MSVLGHEAQHARPVPQRADEDWRSVGTWAAGSQREAVDTVVGSGKVEPSVVQQPPDNHQGLFKTRD